MEKVQGWLAPSLTPLEGGKGIGDGGVAQKKTPGTRRSGRGKEEGRGKTKNKNSRNKKKLEEKERKQGKTTEKWTGSQKEKSQPFVKRSQPKTSSKKPREY